MAETDGRRRYQASMVLSGVGDAVGYKNEEWEYCTSGPKIHEELAALGGLDRIDLKLPGWPVSDDTVMHLALAEALTSETGNREDLLLKIASNFKECMKDMEGRKPGPTSIKGTDLIDPSKPDGYKIPFNPTGTGCGAAMRSMCIGLRYPNESDEDDLIAVSIESGRMTHHHPTGFLGSLASALFTAYAYRSKPVVSWGPSLLKILPRALAYIEATGVAVEEIKDTWNYFQEKWNWYLKRGIDDEECGAKSPDSNSVADRDEIYKTFSLDGWAGRSGHDAPMIAYDALLAAGSDWHELCSRAMFHAGDSDSTGVIAGACFGAMYGYDGVPELNYKNLEYRERLEKQGDLLYTLSHK